MPTLGLWCFVKIGRGLLHALSGKDAAIGVRKGYITDVTDQMTKQLFIIKTQRSK